MGTIPCPTLMDFKQGDQCFESMAGLGTSVYIGLKADLKQPMVATDDEYATPVFNSGKGLYKLDCKDESQQIESKSLGNNKGFEQTLEVTLDAVNKITSKLGRALNNLDYFIIVKDGKESQIMYDENRRVKIENGGITSKTGKKADDERQTDVKFTLKPVLYPNYFVTEPTQGGWDSLLATKSGSSVG